MFGLGMGELLVILVIVLLVFGAGKLPQIGDALGKSIRNFKSAANHENQIEVGKRKELPGGSDDTEDADVSPTAKAADKKS
jgi:sec-independent protein translocase protein TatA